MNALNFALAISETVMAIALAPLLLGLVDQCRAWLQNRRGAGLLQPYRTLR
ncbi:MAG: formate hydrogenlyase, partial [Lysobacterales bacterium CG_4_9_14_3_um_filter_62_6]